jgi:hypothetical protein
MFCFLRLEARLAAAAHFIFYAVREKKKAYREKEREK